MSNCVDVHVARTDSCGGTGDEGGASEVSKSDSSEYSCESSKSQPESPSSEKGSLVERQVNLDGGELRTSISFKERLCLFPIEFSASLNRPGRSRLGISSARASYASSERVLSASSSSLVGTAGSDDPVDDGHPGSVVINFTRIEFLGGVVKRVTFYKFSLWKVGITNDKIKILDRVPLLWKKGWIFVSSDQASSTSLSGSATLPW